MPFSIVASIAQRALKLLRTRLTGTVQSSFASLTIVQRYSNPDSASEAKDCTLHINANLNFIVYNVRVTVNDTVLDFVLREVGESQDAFQQAAEASSFAGIGLKHESSDALHLMIGSIPPSCEFDIEYSCSLNASLGGDTELRFTVPYTSDSADCLTSSFDADLSIFQLTPIVSVTSDQEGFSYDAASKHQGRLRVAAPRFSGARELAFSVTFSERVETTVVSTLIDGQPFVGLSIVADIPSQEDMKCDICLVIDCSGSMTGTPIRTARTTLQFFLKSLPKSCYFNVIRFGSTHEIMFPQSVEYTAETFEQANQRVESMAADLGQTDLLSPLSSVFRTPTQPGYSRQVFVLTDGQVEQEGEIMALCSKHRRDHRIFGVGIGNDISRSFIEDLAIATGGKAAFVATGGDEALVATMDQLRSALRPAIVDSQLHISETEVFEVSPFPIPSLFDRVVTHVYVRLSAPITDGCGVLVSGKSGEKRPEIVAACRHVPPGIRFDKLFGYFNLRDLEEKISIAPAGELPSLRQQAIKVSIDTGLLTQFTALSAVSDTSLTSFTSVRLDQSQHQSKQHPRPDRPVAPRAFQTSPSCRQARDSASYRRQFTHRESTTTSAFRWVDVGEPLKSRPPLRPADQLLALAPAAPRVATQPLAWALAPPRLAAPGRAMVPALPGSGVRDIVALAGFDGAWVVESPLLPVRDVDWSAVPELAAIAGHEAIEHVKRTILALALLQKKGASERVLWELIAQKGIDWLRAVLPDVDWPEVVARVQGRIAD